MKDSVKFKDQVSDCLVFLSEQGWSDLIDERWEANVHGELLARWPDLDEKVWDRVKKDIFI